MGERAIPVSSLIDVEKNVRLVRALHTPIEESNKIQQEVLDRQP